MGGTTILRILDKILHILHIILISLISKQEIRLTEPPFDTMYPCLYRLHPYKWLCYMSECLGVISHTHKPHIAKKSKVRIPYNTEVHNKYNTSLKGYSL